jgi:hypothetical protein
MQSIKKLLKRAGIQGSTAGPQPGAYDGIDLVMAEIRRARRFDVSVSLALFQPVAASGHKDARYFAENVYAEMREFDYVVFDEVEGSLALWLFGTPLDGARLKVSRLRASPSVGAVLRDVPAGFAAFPEDGMTYEALMEQALADLASQAESARVASSQPGRAALEKTA